MDHASQMYRFVRLANTVLFATALALLLDQSTSYAFDRFLQVPHWRSSERALVVVDKTGDRSWNDATRHAASAWDAVARGTGISVTWTTATGPCAPNGERIEVCLEPAQLLAGGAHNDREGLTDLKLGADRTQAHISGSTISVCSNCHLEAGRQRVVATHELGHAFGLEHSLRSGSVMYPSGGPDRPDDGDVAALRELYAHVDENDHCGVFGLQLGPFCF